MKVFLDTNVLVSAFATRGLSTQLVEFVMLEHELLTGDRVLLELDRTLKVKFRATSELRAQAIRSIEEEAALIVHDAKAAECAADDDDRIVLGEALAGGAEVFVTGDKALLRLAKLGELQILSPRQLWERFQEKSAQ